MHKVFFLFLFLILSTQVFAEIVVAPSVELLTIQSEIIAKGKIIKVNDFQDEKNKSLKTIILSIDDLLKGKSDKPNLSIILDKYQLNKIQRNSEDFGNEFLVLLKKSKINERKYVPTLSNLPTSIFNLNKIPDLVFDKNGYLLNDADLILNTVNLWSNKHTKYSIRIDAKLPAIRSYGIYVNVPAEENYKNTFLLMAQAQDVNKKLKAAKELYKFPGQDTVDALYILLEDETEFTYKFASDVLSKIEYSVRLNAYNSLKILGEDPPQKEFKRKITREERRILREKVWRKSFRNALSNDWIISRVEDGNSIEYEGRDTTSVIITCKNNNAIIKFFLIPKEWNESLLPNGKKLGNQPNTQGSRHFFYSGNLPKEIQDKLIKYYNLKTKEELKQ